MLIPIFHVSLFRALDALIFPCAPSPTTRAASPCIASGGHQVHLSRRSAQFQRHPSHPSHTPHTSTYTPGLKGRANGIGVHRSSAGVKKMHRLAALTMPLHRPCRNSDMGSSRQAVCRYQKRAHRWLTYPETCGADRKAALIVVLVSMGSWMIPRATSRNTRHAIIFMKGIYPGTRMNRRLMGSEGESIVARFGTKNPIVALRERQNQDGVTICIDALQIINLSTLQERS